MFRLRVKWFALLRDLFINCGHFTLRTVALYINANLDDAILVYFRSVSLKVFICVPPIVEVYQKLVISRLWLFVVLSSSICCFWVLYGCFLVTFVLHFLAACY